MVLETNVEWNTLCPKTLRSSVNFNFETTSPFFERRCAKSSVFCSEFIQLFTISVLSMKPVNVFTKKIICMPACKIKLSQATRFLHGKSLSSSSDISFLSNLHTTSENLSRKTNIICVIWWEILPPCILLRPKIFFVVTHTLLFALSSPMHCHESTLSSSKRVSELIVNALK